MEAGDGEAADDYQKADEVSSVVSGEGGKSDNLYDSTGNLAVSHVITFTPLTTNSCFFFFFRFFFFILMKLCCSYSLTLGMLK